MGSITFYFISQFSAFHDSFSIKMSVVWEKVIINKYKASKDHFNLTNKQLKY